MINNKVKHYIVNENETIANAFWRFTANNQITIVVDDEDKFVGVVGRKEYFLAKNINENEKVKKIVNRNCKKIICNNGIDEYMQARNIYAEYNIECIPVINQESDIIDLFTRQRAFYKQFFQDGMLERMNYAVCIMGAALEAKKFGLDRISIIEFGVGGGQGLLAAQTHAREISKLLDIQIDVYGFDMGSGLPDALDNIEDMVHIFSSGDFKMEQRRLEIRLYENTKLILGNIEDTLENFMQEYYPSVIGAVFVDVDYYSSTKIILDWMGKAFMEEAFLPRTFMYFDDVSDLYEGIGESKAIKEFNKIQEGNICIFPENTSVNLDWLDIIYGIKTKWLNNRNDYTYPRIKLCHYFKNSYYNVKSFNQKDSISIVENI